MPLELVFLHGLEGTPHGSKYVTLSSLDCGAVRAPDCSGMEDPDARFRSIETALAGRRYLLLVGSSFGGLMAIRFAAAHPDQVGGVVLCAPAVHKPEWGEVPDLPPGLPARVLHGEADEVVPLEKVQAYCARNRRTLRVVQDGHRLQGSHEALKELVLEVWQEAQAREPV